VAKTSRAARSGPELFNLDQPSARDRGDNKLCDSLPRFNCDQMLTQVDQDDVDLAAIIGIDRAGRIHQREPFLECAATSGSYLPLKPWRYFNCNSSRNRGAAERLEHQRFVERSNQIKPCCMLALITRHCSTQALNFDNRGDHDSSMPRQS
jgi:hypothetical protein